MDNKRKYLALKCDVCGDDYLQQERVFKKSKFKNRCEKHRKKYNYCVDCGIVIFRKSTRCKKCYGKTKKYNDKFCIDCGVKILYNSTRCLRCHNINQDKGSTTERNKFNNSKAWVELRVLCFTRDDYTCQQCGDRNYKGRNKSLVLNAHHIKPWHNNKDKRLDIKNLITYCETCHKHWHNKNGIK